MFQRIGWIFRKNISFTVVANGTIFAVKIQKKQLKQLYQDFALWDAPFPCVVVSNKIIASTEPKNILIVGAEEEFFYADCADIYKAYWHSVSSMTGDDAWWSGSSQYIKGRYSWMKHLVYLYPRALDGLQCSCAGLKFIIIGILAHELGHALDPSDRFTTGIRKREQYACEAGEMMIKKFLDRWSACVSVRQLA